MNFATQCSGIEAASVAWNPLGWEAQFFSEIDKFPCAVLAHHYPSVPNYGDMTRFKDWPDATLDVLAAGTPCQSFSNAGLRAGLDDPRGQLMLTFGATVARYRPRWLVWENVPGVLSSNGGRDFGAFLGLLGFLGYGFAYRVLDAQYVCVDGYPRAVPQRRQRVFVVGCLGDWRSAAAVLFEREGLRGDPAPRRKAGARIADRSSRGVEEGSSRDRVAATLTRGAESSGKGGYAGRRQEDDVNIVAGTLCANGKAAGSATSQDAQAGMLVAAYGGNNTSGPISVSSALSAHGGSGRMDFESETFVAHTLRGDGFDASEDGTGRGTPLVPVYTPDVAATMVARSSRGGGQTNSPGHQADGELIAFDTTQITSAQNRNNPKPGDPCHPIAAGAHAPSIAFPANLSGTQHASTENLSPALGAKNPTAVAFDTCLDANSPPPALLTPSSVRRLTPRECERLMGFPDDYTLIPWRGKPASECPDGPRYKALGNSWAVNCARWIGMRIQMVDQIERIAA